MNHWSDIPDHLDPAGGHTGGTHQYYDRGCKLLEAKMGEDNTKQDLNMFFNIRVGDLAR